jgi:hypothetical protein
VFYLYKKSTTTSAIQKRAEPELIHLADLETEKGVIEELERSGLHAGDVELFTKKAEVKEKTEIWIETNGK